jgi:hypothetical protein
MIVHECENIQNTQEARVLATLHAVCRMGSAVHSRMRNAISAINHTWAVVRDEILEGLAKAPLLH